jgi:hypothetical protein
MCGRHSDVRDITRTSPQHGQHPGLHRPSQRPPRNNVPPTPGRFALPNSPRGGTENTSDIGTSPHVAAHHCTRVHTSLHWGTTDCKRAGAVAKEHSHKHAPKLAELLQNNLQNTNEHIKKGVEWVCVHSYVWHITQNCAIPCCQRGGWPRHTQE